VVVAVFGYIAGLILYTVGIWLFRQVRFWKRIYKIIRWLDKLIPDNRHSPVYAEIEMALYPKLVKKLGLGHNVPTTYDTKQSLSLYSMAGAYIEATATKDKPDDYLSALEGLYRSTAALMLIEMIYLPCLLWNANSSEAIITSFTAAGVALICVWFCAYARNYYHNLRIERNYGRILIELNKE
jgi:hypothetical protein